MTGRDALWRVLSSVPYKTWAAVYRTDAGKVQSEWNGVRRPLPSSGFARGLVELIRLFPKTVPPPAGSGVPLPTAMWVQSDSEDLAKAKAAGLKSCLFQMGFDDWALLKTRAKNLGLPWGYWFQCLTVADLDRLLAACKAENTALCGINIEKELEGPLTPTEIRQSIDASGYPIDRCLMVVYGWLQNSVRVTNSDIASLTWLIEMFYQDAAELWRPSGKLDHCLAHARAAGITGPITQLMGIYDVSPAQVREIAAIHPSPPPAGAAQPSYYNRVLPADRSVYPANMIRDEWSRWLS